MFLVILFCKNYFLYLLKMLFLSLFFLLFHISPQLNFECIMWYGNFNYLPGSIGSPYINYSHHGFQPLMFSHPLQPLQVYNPAYTITIINWIHNCCIIGHGILQMKTLWFTCLVMIIYRLNNILTFMICFGIV